MGNLVTTRRNLFAAFAVVPALALPAIVAAAPGAGAFDDAFRTYCRLRDADRYDAEHGALGAANDLHDAQVASFVACYQSFDRAPPEARSAWQRYFDEVKQAEEAHRLAFSEPRWDAFAALAAVPAPTLAALTLKVETAMDEDGGLDAVEAHILADLRRFAAEGR